MKNSEIEYILNEIVQLRLTLNRLEVSITNVGSGTLRNNFISLSEKISVNIKNLCDLVDKSLERKLRKELNKKHKILKDNIS